MAAKAPVNPAGNVPPLQPFGRPRRFPRAAGRMGLPSDIPGRVSVPTYTGSARWTISMGRPLGSCRGGSGRLVQRSQ